MSDGRSVDVLFWVVFVVFSTIFNFFVELTLLIRTQRRPKISKGNSQMKDERSTYNRLVNSFFIEIKNEALCMGSK